MATKTHVGNKKVGKFESSDFGALASQQFVTVPETIGFIDNPVKPHFPTSSWGFRATGIST
jgi:hypothetical protein